MSTVARQLPSEELEIIKRLRLEGRSYLEIALVVRRSSDSVSFWCRSMGLGNVKRSDTIPHREDLRRMVADLFEQGASIRAIAHHLGVNRDHVQKIVAKLGIVRTRKVSGPAAGVTPYSVSSASDARFHGSIFICRDSSPEFVAKMREAYGDRVKFSEPVRPTIHGVKFFVDAA